MAKHQVVVRFKLFYNYSDCCNAKNIIYFDQRRVKLKILVISFFLARLYWNASPANHYEFQPCFWLAKSTVVFFVFLGNEHIFRRKNYIAFVYLLKSTSLQKKSDFDFLSLPTNRRFWSIFVCMDSLLKCL